MRALLALGVLAALALSVTSAHADAIDIESRQLRSSASYKRRLAAALALSKSHDGRAVAALAQALRTDGEPQIRRVAALALPKALDATTPPRVRDVAIEALEKAAVKDKDAKVRELAARALTKVAALRPRQELAPGAPAVFVHVGQAADLSSKAPRDTMPKLTKVVRGVVQRKASDMSTTWPGSLPTEKQLNAAGSRAFIVAATISAVDIKRSGTKAEIACTVSVRVAPWNGTDGSEKWVAQKAASASGSGKAMTGSASVAIEGGIRDCVLAVGEELTQKQVVPFLKRIAGDS
ncbi:MAG: HEAT repeat domain-containing protein [Deltaproteobacteria bacterium]|nr:HEAT repeat domain-containing protein [Kofleriaceae bacterium]